MLTLLTVVLFLGVIVGYLAGVKRGAPWGSPVVVLCALGVIAVVLVNAFAPSGMRDEEEESPIYGDLEKAGRLIGEQLKGDLGPGSRVVIVGVGGENRVGFNENFPLFKDGLSAGLGHNEWEPRGQLTVVTAEAISNGVLQNRPVDAIISFDGLPEDLTSIRYRGSQRPIVAAFFLSATGLKPVNLETIRGWLRDGYLDVAAVETKKAGLDSATTSFEVYTPSMLP